MLTYKFRLCPTNQQERLFDRTIETCRRLYNSMLSERIDKPVGYFEQQKHLVELKKDNKYLREVHSQILQDVVLRVDKAFQRYFKGISNHPRFKRTGRYNSFTYPQYGKSFKLDECHIKLGRIGRVKVILHREIVGEAKTATIIKDIDQWYVALTVRDSPTARKTTSTGNAVGIDLGVSSVIALSDGTTVANPRFTEEAGSRIRSAQKKLSRTQVGSHRRRKAQIALARAWRKVRRQRDDFAHKLSNQLARNNSLIVFEDLPVTRMVHNHSLASAIMDSAWGKLRQMTAYKAERRGGRTILVNPSGTSQKCSGCGREIPKDLGERTHRCHFCGLVLNRDVNAARNILAVGLVQALAETEPLLVHRTRISKFSRGSEKPLALC